MVGKAELACASLLGSFPRACNGCGDNEEAVGKGKLSLLKNLEGINL